MRIGMWADGEEKGKGIVGFIKGIEIRLGNLEFG